MTARYRVLLTDRPWADTDIEREALSELDAELVEPPDERETTLIEFARDVDAIGTCWAKVSEPVIRAATRCKVISRYGIGLDNIDLKTATELGIPVTNVPDYCIEEVADHTLGLLLSLARKISIYHQRLKQGEYGISPESHLPRLSEQTLGIIGLGRIGQALVPRAQALGLTVLAHNRSGNDYGTGCNMVDLSTVLQADYISLHLPLTEETHHLISSETLAGMKPTAFLINTSRGGLVDQEALWNSIQNGQLAGAGLDVFETEPPDLSHPLFQDERIICTPHLAFVSDASLRELRSRATMHIMQVLHGERATHVVNF